MKKIFKYNEEDGRGRRKSNDDLLIDMDLKKMYALLKGNDYTRLSEIFKEFYMAGFNNEDMPADIDFDNKISNLYTFGTV